MFTSILLIYVYKAKLECDGGAVFLMVLADLALAGIIF